VTDEAKPPAPAPKLILLGERSAGDKGDRTDEKAATCTDGMCN
jgi:hypothetical protein